ncbi:MAG: heme-binding protein [Pseudomonas sp.]
MNHKLQLTQQETDRMLRLARAEAQTNQWAVSIAIVDDGGHLLALERLDGCAPIAAYIATEKARTSALGRRESGSYESMINGGRQAFLSAPLLQGMLEGGVPVLVEGQVVGAVGVSGVMASQDVQVARKAVAALEI